MALYCLHNPYRTLFSRSRCPGIVARDVTNHVFGFSPCRWPGFGSVAILMSAKSSLVPLFDGFNIFIILIERLSYREISCLSPGSFIAAGFHRVLLFTPLFVSLLKVVHAQQTSHDGFLLSIIISLLNYYWFQSRKRLLVLYIYIYLHTST